LGESERRRGVLRRKEQADNRAEAILMDDETGRLLRDFDVIDGRGADIDAIERDRSAWGIRGDGPGSALERDDAEAVHMAAVHGFVGRIDFRDKSLLIAEESLLLASVLQPESVRNGLLLRERDGRRREILMRSHRDRSGRGGIREPGGQVLLKDRSGGQMVTAVGLIECVMDILPRRANARGIKRHHSGLKHQGFALLYLARELDRLKARFEERKDRRRADFGLDRAVRGFIDELLVLIVERGARGIRDHEDLAMSHRRKREIGGRDILRLAAQAIPREIR
jgi:hypothetical protein